MDTPGSLFEDEEVCFLPGEHCMFLPQTRPLAFISVWGSCQLQLCRLVAKQHYFIANSGCVVGRDVFL